MSEINHASVYYPPSFPELGRLPRHAQQVHRNLRQQNQQGRDYHDALSVEAGRRVMPPCCKTLHISLFFDGTGNNLNHDLYLANPTHPTNIARLFRASIGTGHAGGTGHVGSTARGLLDTSVLGNADYFKYYMPGVGTPFAEVGDLDYTTLGLASARYGEERVNWGLMMLIDALRRALELPRLDIAAQSRAVKAMGTLPGMESAMGRANRSNEFRRQLDALEKPLRIALSDYHPGRSRLLGLRLYVYGFSRGAAAARAFVNWLNGLLSRTASTPSFALRDLTLPVSVEYLGLLDTVASVGLADIFPGATGHMSWADGNQQIPERLVKRCLHIVASHEQRLCFPLESIRQESGGYPANSTEVIYPGVHSDQGGGYPPGDQGKAVGRDDRLLLSQIALHDLYVDAFAHGAPLKVPPRSLPVGLSNELWRAMEPDVEIAFGVSPEVARRFNAWREVTLGQLPVSQPLSPEQTELYQPLPSTISLEQALREQMAWITAWRIDRYAFASLKQTSFYAQASDTEADPIDRKNAEAARNARQALIEKGRREQQVNEQFKRAAPMPLAPGVKDFDADMAQTQLRQAAEEFGIDYRNPSVITPFVVRLARLAIIPALVANQASPEARVERQLMRNAGKEKVSLLFPPPKHERNHVSETLRLNVDESRNAKEPTGLLRALFDDQVHDSRAWFLYSLGREHGGSYFGERMVFFGESNRRELVLFLEKNGQLLAEDAGRRRLEAERAQQPPYMDVERMAAVMKAIDARWAAYDAQDAGAIDGTV